MRRVPYSEREVACCTFIARFGEVQGIDVDVIAQIAPRSVASVKMKVSNIVAQLRERGLPSDLAQHSLSGLPTGEVGRNTHWHWIEPLTKLDRLQLERRCRMP